MALIHSLLRLKDYNLVERFDLLDGERAIVYLPDGRSIVVYMCKDYLVDVPAIEDAVNDGNRADYIVFNAWDRPSPAAFTRAKNLRVPFISFLTFQNMLGDGTV
jgi:hypothetical protein